MFRLVQERCVTWLQKYGSLLFVGCIAVWMYYNLFIHRLFLRPDGKIGQDHMLWVPRLLAGYYAHLRHSWWEVPWFTPAFAGGSLLAANPQSVYFSFPQWFTFFVDPVTAIWWTTFLFALLGFCGFFVLLRRSFGCEQWPSLLGAMCFFFNHFYIAHMYEGHITYHSVMLFPWIVVGLIGTSGQNMENALGGNSVPSKVSEWMSWFGGGWGCVSSLCCVYVLYSGNLNLIVPMGLGILALGCLFVLSGGDARVLWKRTFGVLFVAGVLSLSRLVMVWAVMRHFPRNFYLLPGFSSLFRRI